jgi:hypothetical protein
VSNDVRTMVGTIRTGYASQQDGTMIRASGLGRSLDQMYHHRRGIELTEGEQEKSTVDGDI